MKSHLKRLVEVMPPPKPVRDAEVDWNRVERIVGISYPPSFKEFISIYGSSVWCDHFSPKHTTGATDQDVKKFVKGLKKDVSLMVDNMFDNKYNKLSLSLYPENEGLLPFMRDYSGSIYCWKTCEESPDGWPIICWFTGQIVVLRDFSISRFFLDWIERTPQMCDILGDINNLPPERVRIS